jgi:hypothetical protein
VTTAFGRGVALALLSLVLGLPRTASIADDDPKEQAAWIAAVARRLERDIRDVDTQATRVGKDQPARAVSLLELGLARLEVDTVLSCEKRAELKRKLNSSLRAYRGRLNDKAEVGGAQDDTRRADEKKVENSLKPVFEVPVRGTSEEGYVGADGRRLCEKPRDDALGGVDGRPLSEGRRGSGGVHSLYEVREGKFVTPEGDRGKQEEVNRDDIPIPLDWLEKSKRRTEVKMTAQERAIMRALNTVFSPDLTEAPLSAFIDWMQKKMDVSITVDNEALAEAKVKHSEPVTIQVKALGRSILKKVLGQLDLTYVIKDNAILITTPGRAREMTAVRTYHLGDLAGVVDVRWGAVLSRQQARQNVLVIANLIQSSFDPKSWAPEGPGKVLFDPVNMALVIRQSAEVHFMIGAALR